MSDGPKISPEAAEGLRMVMKLRREGKLPDSPYPVVFPHIARPLTTFALQYSQPDDPGSFNDASLAGYKVQTGNGPYIGYDMAKGDDMTCIVRFGPPRSVVIRRRLYLTVATCFILAGLGFAALLIGG